MLQRTQEVLDLLNKALSLDTVAISKLIHFRVRITKKEFLTSNLPFIVQDDELGLLGFLNGYCDDPEVRLAAVVDSPIKGDYQAWDLCIIQRFVAVPIKDCVLKEDHD